MRQITYIILCFFCVSVTFAQQDEAEKLKKQSKKYTYNANKALEDDSFAEAEAEYRKAISKDAGNVTAKYNLGNAYYEKESYEAAFDRYKQAATVAETKAERHSAFHNMGNIFMKKKEYGKAVEAYKDALRNDPTDDETRYNLALAKEMLDKNPPKENEDDKKDKDQKEQQKEDENKKDQDKNDQKDKNDDQGDKEKDEGGKDDQNKDGKGDQEKEKNKQDDKQDQNKSDQQKDQQQKQQPKPNQLSPQQIKSLLQAMNNAEKKTQDKLNEKKAKGIKVKAEKDW